MQNTSFIRLRCRITLCHYFRIKQHCFKSKIVTINWATSSSNYFSHCIAIPYDKRKTIYPILLPQSTVFFSCFPAQSKRCAKKLCISRGWNQKAADKKPQQTYLPKKERNPTPCTTRQCGTALLEIKKYQSTPVLHNALLHWGFKETNPRMLWTMLCKV